jgi:hypothetical protein
MVFNSIFLKILNKIPSSGKRKDLVAIVKELLREGSNMCLGSTDIQVFGDDEDIQGFLPSPLVTW